jgi:hypothetical protein
VKFARVDCSRRPVLRATLGSAPDPWAPGETTVDVETASVPNIGTSWSWAPHAPWESVEACRYAVEAWAPASTVRHPWVRVGRWTVFYRRAG